MKTCAYCNKEFKKLTVEHTFNKALLKKLFPRDGDTFNDTGYAHCYEDYTANYLTTRDVCNVCNNEVLGSLDNYFLEFLDKSLIFETNITNDTKLKLDYDYDRLSRWLLKTLYNSERKNAYKGFSKKMQNYSKHILKKENIAYSIYLEILNDVSESDAIKVKKVSKDFKNFIKSGNVLIGLHNEHYIKYFLVGNLIFYVFVAQNKQNANNEIYEQIKLFKTTYTDLNIKIFDLNKNKKFYMSSNRTIIDILDQTMEGNREFAYPQKSI